MQNLSLELGLSIAFLMYLILSEINILSNRNDSEKAKDINKERVFFLSTTIGSFIIFHLILASFFDFFKFGIFIYVHLGLCAIAVVIDAFVFIIENNSFIRLLNPVPMWKEFSSKTKLLVLGGMVGLLVMIGLSISYTPPQGALIEGDPLSAIMNTVIGETGFVVTTVFMIFGALLSIIGKSRMDDTYGMVGTLAVAGLPIMDLVVGFISDLEFLYVRESAIYIMLEGSLMLSVFVFLIVKIFVYLLILSMIVPFVRIAGKI